MSLFLFGGPVMYFLRDGIGLLPGSIVFTAFFQVFCLVLMMPMSLSGFKKLNKPNVNAYYYSYWFLALGVLYLFIYYPNYTTFNFTNTLIYDVFIISFFFLLLTVSFDDVLDSFVPITMFVATIGSVLMLIYVFKNPNFVLGQRAAVSFTGLAKDSDYRNMGNPHIYSKVAVAGFWAGVLLRKDKKTSMRILANFSVLITFVTLLLNQVMASYLALVLGFVFYSYYDRSILIGIKNWLFSWKGLTLLTALCLIVGYVVLYTELGQALGMYSEFVFSRTEKIANLLLGVSEKNIDQSAVGRVDGIAVVANGFIESIDGYFWYFIFGHGYESIYVDSPFFQTFQDLGIIGFLLYFMVLRSFWKGAVIAVKYRESMLTIFISLYFFMTLVYAFTQGQPYGYYAWYYYALYARFLGTSTLINSKNMAFSRSQQN